MTTKMPMTGGMGVIRPAPTGTPAIMDPNALR